MAQKLSCTIIVLAWRMALVLFFSGAGQAKPEYIFTTLDVPGATFTSVAGINNLGQIVGNSSAGSFLLSGGNYTTLNLPGPPSGINASGQIVGSTGNLGYLYSGGSYTTIDVGPVSGGTAASGINDSGQVVGYWTERRGFGRTYGFLYSGGSYTLLQFGQYTPAFGINNLGQIVGQAFDPNFGPGFLLTDGSYTTFGIYTTVGRGINDSSQIVGYSYMYPNGMHHAFLLNGDNYTTFDVPGATTTEAYGINNSGEIVGTYVDAGGIQHGFLAALAPVPEPSTLLLLGISMLGLIGWGWRLQRAATRVPERTGDRRPGRLGGILRPPGQVVRSGYLRPRAAQVERTMMSFTDWLCLLYWA